MHIKFKFLFNVLFVNIVIDEVKGYVKYRRDEQRLQNGTLINNSQQAVSPPIIHIRNSRDNVQQLFPKENELQSLGAVVPKVEDGPNEVSGSKYSKERRVAAHNVQNAQDKVAAEWPLGVVPYCIDKNIYDTATTNRIVKAMRVVESSSCVIFKELRSKPTSNNSNFMWLDITNPTQERECVHKTSINDCGGTVVVLGFDCLHPEEVLHSILHAIGFKDEVSHPHRDTYVGILWDNIQPKYRHLFRIEYDDAPYKLVEYDPLSVMHFHCRAFSINGAQTIIPKVPGLQIGNSALSTNTLSQLDIMKLKLAFDHECKKRKIDDLFNTCKKVLLSKHEGKIDQSQNIDETISEHKEEK